MYKQAMFLLLQLVLFGGVSALASADSEPLWGQAYAQQGDAVRAVLAGRQPFGFKAGLTSAVGQQRFGSDRAVSGVLLATAQLRPQNSLRLSDFGKPMVELELAFRFARTITEPVESIDELKAAVAAIATAVELPDLSVLAAPFTVFDIVAANVAAHSVIMGAPKRIEDCQCDSSAVRLSRDGEAIIGGNVAELDGGVWESLLFLVNSTLENGWVIYPQQWLLTGAIGGMKPLLVGHYRAQIEGFAPLEFTVVAQ
ncbi:MAG: 2-keto-4-pentenoate hydratase [Spongiibacteraceae bacterium]